MDYKKLVEQLRSASLLHGSWIRDRMTEAADAIETLLAERDAAQKEAQDLQIQWDMYGGDEGVTVAFQKAAERDAAVECMRGECGKCVNLEVSMDSMPCRDCYNGMADHWQWRGPQKGENNDQTKL